MTPSLGSFDKRITIQYNNGTTDQVRGQTKQWTALCTIWANVEPLSSYLQTMAAQRGIFATHKVTAWYKSIMPLVNNTCPDKRLRVVYNGRTYDVAGLVDPGERHETIELTVRETIP